MTSPYTNRSLLAHTGQNSRVDAEVIRLSRFDSYSHRF